MNEDKPSLFPLDPLGCPLPPFSAQSMMSMGMRKTTITLPCRRCGSGGREQANPGMCVWCAAVVAPDPAREAQIDRRLHDMRQIHEIEMSMTYLQRRELIMHGRYILDRDRGESVGFGLGEK